MPVFMLSQDLFFPEPELASSDGLLALGGDLKSDRLLQAYEMGIFPWFSPGEPIMWWSPDPRCVLFPQDLKVSKSMRNVINRNMYTISFDKAFNEVVEGCASPREKEEGTWIGHDMKVAYSNLHQLGMAHSVEVWDGDELVGGLYGVSIGGVFYGESMFSRKSNASKLALIKLLRHPSLKFNMVDCQMYNKHLASLGAVEISRSDFLSKLSEGLTYPTHRGSWSELAEVV